MLNHTNAINENAPQEIGENSDVSVTDVVSHETFEEYWDPFQNENWWVAQFHAFVDHLNSKRRPACLVVTRATTW